MAKLFFCLNLTALGCAVVTLTFGIVQLFRTKQGTYVQTAIMGIGALTMGLLFCFVFTVSGGNPSGFSLGFLGMLSAFLFFWTSNRSYISVLEDAETKYKKRASRIALLLPIFLLAEFVLILLRRGFVLAILPPVLLCAVTGLCTYYTFREVLLPDIKNGFIDCMRPFNVVLCVLAVCCMTMELFAAYEAVLPCPEVWYVTLCILSDATILSLSFFLYRGVHRWAT